VVPAAYRTVEERLGEEEPDPYQEGGEDEIAGDRHQRTGRDRPMGPQAPGKPLRQAGSCLEDRRPFHGLVFPTKGYRGNLAKPIIPKEAVAWSCCSSCS